MITGMEAAVVPEQFLNTTFFGRTEFFAGRFCQVDSRKARRLLAPVVKYGQPGRVVSREPVTTKFYDVPEIKPMRTTTVTDLDQREFGESAYSKRTPEERFAERLAKDTSDLIGAATRRIEQMTSSLLFIGLVQLQARLGRNGNLELWHDHSDGAGHEMGRGGQ